MRPERILELVLDIEQPDADRGREQHDRHMHEQERTDADQPHHRGDESRDGDIGRHGAEPGLPAAAHDADRQPVLHNEQIGRTDAEHDDRMAIEAIAQADPIGDRARYSRTVSVSISPIPRRSRLPEVA